MVVEGVCLLGVLIGRLGRRGAGLVGVLNEVPAVVEHEFGTPVVQCEYQAPLDLLEKNSEAACYCSPVLRPDLGFCI